MLTLVCICLRSARKVFWFMKTTVCLKSLSSFKHKSESWRASLRIRANWSFRCKVFCAGTLCPASLQLPASVTRLPPGNQKALSKWTAAKKGSVKVDNQKRRRARLSQRTKAGSLVRSWTEAWANFSKLGAAPHHRQGQQFRKRYLKF